MLTQRLVSLWQQAWGIRQTRYLIIYLFAAYGSYLIWLGIRPIVFLSGALIFVFTLLAWVSTPRLPPQESDESDLLNPSVFYAQLEVSRSLLQRDLFGQVALGYWEKTYAQVDAIHQLAVAIAHQESLFIPDLLDTLHTVLSLSTQFSKAFNAAKKMKTSSYKEMAQQHMKASTYRLSQTYSQLQELHDQLLANGIEAELSDASSGVSQRLQTLIKDNASAIQS